MDSDPTAYQAAVRTSSEHARAHTHSVCVCVCVCVCSNLLDLTLALFLACSLWLYCFRIWQIESLVTGYQLLCDALSPVALPLVVNTMGWVRGLGLQLLTQTIEQLRPTFLLALSSAQQLQQVASSQPVTPRGSNSDTTADEESDDADPTGGAATAVPPASPKSTSRPAGVPHTLSCR